MKSLLVQCPVEGLGSMDLAPPLGLLRLLAALHAECELLDLNLRWQEAGANWRASWPQSAVAEIVAHQPAIVGLTSMAIESHLALELARCVKVVLPDTVIVVGGPHFGSIADEVLAAHPFIDGVVAGEGDDVVADFFVALASGRLNATAPLGGAPRGANAVCRPTRPVNVADLKPIPFDRIDLDRYWRANPRRLLNVELSRGCKYHCSYCYVNSHLGPGARHMSPGIAADVMQDAAARGARRVFVVGDNFLNDRQWVLDVCAEIAARDLGLEWDCYATLPDIDDDVARALARAGCVTAYVGVDAVEITQQKRFRKRFFSAWGSVRTQMTILRSAGIDPTAAFVLTGLGAERHQTEQNLHAALDLRIRNLAYCRLNVLSEYPGTALGMPHVRGRVISSQIKIDLLQSVPVPVRENPYAVERPDLYPFHSVSADPNKGEMLVCLAFDMDYLLEFRPYLLHAACRCLTDRSDSETPLLDWWQSALNNGIGTAREPLVRRAALEKALPEIARSFSSRLVDAAWEFECATDLLASDTEPRSLTCFVAGHTESVWTPPSVAISREAADYFLSGGTRIDGMRGEMAPATDFPTTGWRVWIAASVDNLSEEIRVAHCGDMSFGAESVGKFVLWPDNGTKVTAEGYLRLQQLGLIIDG